MNPGKKISFGFSKLSKKPQIISKPKEKQLEFVDHLEGQSIKLKNEQQTIEKEPLIIPLRDNKKDLMDRVRDMKAKQKSNAEIEDNRPDSELTEDELAARELLREAKLRIAGHHSTDNKVFVLPIKTEAELPLEGEKESTIDDYENVPVGDFGLAMLRGMGWKEGVGIGKNPATSSLFKPPELRPKGLGLGASTIANSDQKNKQVADNNGEVLILKSGSYAKIVAGNQKGSYCEVQGLDDEAGRIIVKTTLKGNILALNEFMLVAVTREEYSRNSKTLNNAKFDAYKEMEQKKRMPEMKPEKSSIEDKIKQENGTKTKNEKNIGNYEKSEANYKKSFSIKPEKSSDDERKSKKEKSSKHRKKDKDDSSDSDSDYEKSRKTHKRKDKKRHRDKSRSPNRKYKSSRKSSRSKHRYSSSDSDSGHELKYNSHSRSESDDNRHRKKNKKHI
ncbi:unnamed protein product [Psylliodes chrysocephalus]|uniref:G-patch domain-containing protein n=1 Tax=Psylliodes chrysocephalus TaxID=3402493 RepID=A0A9P0D537_9CUCU|nr:unnamed protein product [Psylliodes chrysocephala]